MFRSILAFPELLILAMFVFLSTFCTSFSFCTSVLNSLSMSESNSTFELDLLSLSERLLLLLLLFAPLFSSLFLPRPGNQTLPLQIPPYSFLMINILINLKVAWTSIIGQAWKKTDLKYFLFNN